MWEWQYRRLVRGTTGSTNDGLKKMVCTIRSVCFRNVWGCTNHFYDKGCSEQYQPFGI